MANFNMLYVIIILIIIHKKVIDYSTVNFTIVLWIVLLFVILHSSSSSSCSLNQLKKIRNKYLEAVEGRRGCFSPFVLSVDGYIGNEARVVLKRIAETLSYKWNRSYSQVINWVRATISFSTFRATGLCLRGSRIKWRSSCGFDDGMGLPNC